MVRHGLKHIFQKPTPDIDASDRTQQLRSKTIYAGTVNLAQSLANGNSSIYKTYNGPYEVVNQAGNSKLIASRSYDELLSITKGKVLLNQLPLTSITQDYYQQHFAKGQIYQGNYNRFDPLFNSYSGCNDSVLVYDISNNGFTGPPSYNANGGFIGVTGPSYSQENNKHIFIDPNHCYYANPCLQNASYTRFVQPDLNGLTGPSHFTAQQIINANQYRGFNYPMPNFNLTCVQQLPDQFNGPIFCPPKIPTLYNFTIPLKVIGDPPFSLMPPTSDSQGTFSYTSNNLSVATVSGSTVTIVGPGSSTITALQAPYGNYGSATISTQLNVSLIVPTLSNFTIPPKVIGDPPFSLVSPTSDSQGTFSYTSNNLSVATVSGSTVTIVGPGSSTITALQAPYGNYGSANISTQLNVSSYIPVTPAFTTTNTTSAIPNTYLFGTAFHGANMTPYFETHQDSGFISANITNDSGGVIPPFTSPPFTSVSSGQTYTTGVLYNTITTGQVVTFTLTVTYSSKPPIILTLAFEYDGDGK